MDGLTGFKTAASQGLPDAVTVMDPFHVVRLAGDALDEHRRRIQRDPFGRRGRKERSHPQSPLQPPHRRGPTCLEVLFTDERYIAVEATWASTSGW